MPNRADQLEPDLREEKPARRREHVDGLLRRFADLVVYNRRVRRLEDALRLGAGLRLGSAGGTSAEAEHVINGGERGTAGGDPPLQVGGIKEGRSAVQIVGQVMQILYNHKADRPSRFITAIMRNACTGDAEVIFGNRPVCERPLGHVDRF